MNIQWQKKYVKSGEAFFLKDQAKIENYIKNQILFLVPVFGDDEVNSFVKTFSKIFTENNNHEIIIVFKNDLTFSLTKRLPEIMIRVYKKMLRDFEKKLENLSSKISK